MSPVPVTVCFGALDALVFAQAAYAAKSLSRGKSEEADDADLPSSGIDPGAGDS